MLRRAHMTLFLALLSSAVVLPSMAAACKPKEPVYFHEIKTSYTTNSLEKAQEQTPFRIILPRYLPQLPRDLPRNTYAGPTFLGTLRPYQENGQTTVYIGYVNISLDETNAPMTIDSPGPDERRVVLKETPVNFYSDKLAVGGLYKATWITKGTSIYAEIGGFPEKEALRVIESTID